MLGQYFRIGLTSILSASLFVASASASVVYSTDFSSGGSSTYVTADTIGTTGWTAITTVGDGGARINGGILELTSDRNGSSTPTGAVRAFVDIAASYNSLSGYQQTLDNSTGIVEWSFNMRQSYSDPSYPLQGAFGVAFILASNSNAYDTAGNGYAVVLGNDTEASPGEPIRLIRFTGGLDATGATNRKTLITAPSPLNGITTEYMSIKVQFNPTNKEWTLMGRDDGTAFIDPKTGTLSPLGSNTDTASTRHTDIALRYAGALYTNGAAVRSASFDNFTVAVVPEPAVLALFGATGLAAARRRRGY